MWPLKSDYKEQLIILTVITLISFHCKFNRNSFKSTIFWFEVKRPSKKVQNLNSAFCTKLVLLKYFFDILSKCNFRQYCCSPWNLLELGLLGHASFTDVYYRESLSISMFKSWRVRSLFIFLTQFTIENLYLHLRMF